MKRVKHHLKLLTQIPLVQTQNICRCFCQGTQLSPNHNGSSDDFPVVSPRIKLRDGRHLAYIERGVPKDIAKYKIVIVHGFGSSKEMNFLAPQELIDELGIYLLQYDRAGYGESDPNPKRSLKSEALDIQELADQLQLGPQFYVIGVSMGSYATWSCLKYLPHRLAGLALIAPVINYRWPSFPKRLIREDYRRKLVQWCMWLANHWPRLLHWWVTQKWLPSTAVIEKNPAFFNKSDVDILKTIPGFPMLTKDSLREKAVFDTLRHDWRVAFGKWEFDPMKLSNPFPHNTEFRFSLLFLFRLFQELAPLSTHMSLQQPNQEVPLQEPEATFSQLSKQNSILSLTLDEFYCKNGKSLGSMNMDEFLSSIWNSDDNNQVNPSLPTLDEAAKGKSVVATEPTTISQPLSVPPPICKKTVDEIWSQIHKSQPHYNEANNSLARNEPLLKRQQTLGEMTLEDFLVKAGVVQESSSLFKSSLLYQNQIGNIASNGPLSASYRFRHVIGTGSSVSCNGLETQNMLAQNNNLVIKDVTTNGAVEKCPSLGESSGKGNRKRIIDGPPEVVVERRQRRMLKNRESAARSRARRQAYTVELEAELNLLKEENEKLKQTLADAERKRKQEISQRKHTTMAQKRTEKLRSMKRPLSASW